MFRRLPSPRLQLLPLLWVFWLVVGVCLSLIPTWRMLRYLDLADIGILLLYVSPIAVVVGCAHYAVLRLRVKRDERSSSRRELWMVPILTVTMSAILGWLVWQNICKNRLRNDIQGESMAIYEKLAKDGQYDELVHRMETACERFDRAKLALDGEIEVRSGANGFSYLYVNLWTTWDSTIRLVPPGVLAFLQLTRFDQYNQPNENGGYGPWKPIAEKVSQSQTPILRALGCCMLEDKKGFAEAANGLAERDPDAVPLASAASSLYPNPAKEH